MLRIIQSALKASNDTVLIPDDSFIPQIAKKFELTRDMLLRAIKTYRYVYAKLWRVDGIRLRYQDGDEYAFEHELKFKVTIKVRRFVYIRGFVSTDELNDLLRNFKPSVIPLDWKIFKGTSHLHSDGIPEFYAMIGVTDVTNVFPTVVEYRKFDRLFSGMNKARDHSELHWVQDDGRVLTLLDDEKWSGVPSLLVRQMRNMVENLSEPTGYVAEYKDICFMLANWLKGQSLVSLCLSSRQMMAWSSTNNFELFRVRLKLEFDIDWSVTTFDYPNPRLLYIQLNTIFARFRGRIFVPPYNVLKFPRKEFFVYADLVQTFAFCIDWRGSLPSSFDFFNNDTVDVYRKFKIDAWQRLKYEEMIVGIDGHSEVHAFRAS